MASVSGPQPVTYHIDIDLTLDPVAVVDVVTRNNGDFRVIGNLAMDLGGPLTQQIGAILDANGVHPDSTPGVTLSITEVLTGGYYGSNDDTPIETAVAPAVTPDPVPDPVVVPDPTPVPDPAPVDPPVDPAPVDPAPVDPPVDPAPAPVDPAPAVDPGVPAA